MNASKFYRWAIGGGCAVLTLIAVAVAGIVHHLNTKNGDADWLGLGTFVLLGVILFFFGLVALIFWFSMRGFLRKGKPKPQVVVVGPQKKWTAGRLIKWVLIVGLIGYVCLAIGTRMTNVSISLIRTPAPQTQGRCDDSFALDDLGTYDFSQSPNDRVLINPGSTTKLCYGTLVSIPGDRWKTWGAQFVPPAGQKERCAVYFSYIYPDHSVRVIGPLYGPQLELSNMSGLWRVATNCPIEYYRW
jgi:hypothetical protein